MEDKMDSLGNETLEESKPIEEKQEKSLFDVRKGQVAVRVESIIEARYKLSARANDVIDMVTVQLEDDENLVYDISLRDYSDYVINNQNVYRDFKKVVKDFSSGGGIWIKEGKNQETWYPWFSKIQYKDAKITAELHKELKEILLKAKRGIFFDIKYSINIINKYAKKYYYCCRLYATSKSDKKTGFRIDRLEDLQRKLEVPKSYFNNFKLFEENVLQVSKDQINEFSDIRIEYEPIKKGKRVTHIRTNIFVKSQEELKSVSEKILNVKAEDRVTRKIDEPVRLQVLELLKKNEDVVKKGLQSKRISEENKNFMKVKEYVAETLGMTIKNVNRYVYINYMLIKEFVDLFDKNFITLGQAEKIAKTPHSEQQKAIKKMKKDVERFKSELIDELAELLHNYKISYNVAEKYSKETESEQRKYYNKHFNKNKVIEVEFKEVEKEIDESAYSEVAVTLDEEKEVVDDYNYNDGNEDLGYLISTEDINGNDYKTKIKNIVKIYNKVDITDKVAENFYLWAQSHEIYGKEPMKLIEEVAKYSTTQNIRDIYKWYETTLKEFIRPMPQAKQEPKLRFDNFKGRDYDYDDLEKKLLGWDYEEEEEQEE